MSESPTDKAKLLVMGVVCWIGLLYFIGSYANKYQVQQERDRKNYCTFVEIWHKGEDLGIPEIKRRGHPDYRGMFDKWCAKRDD